MVGSSNYAHVRPFSLDVIHTQVMQEAERGGWHPQFSHLVIILKWI
jgi:hypothetical protein